MKYFYLLAAFFLTSCASVPSPEAMQVIYQLSDDVKNKQMQFQQVIQQYDMALTECRNDPTKDHSKSEKAKKKEPAKPAK